jgi:hypothetical protein
MSTDAGSVAERDLRRIEELFHELIRSRAREGGLDVPADLPAITQLAAGGEPQWFAVPGMYGGFSYRLVAGKDGLHLVSESWSRVVEGSGMRHVITPSAVTLEEEGFV